jgi:hypothetical protein
LAKAGWPANLNDLPRALQRSCVPMSFLGNLMAEHDPPQRTWDSSPHALHQDNERLLRAKSSKHSYRNAAAEPTYAARGHEMLAASWPQVVDAQVDGADSGKWRAGVSSAFRQHTTTLNCGNLTPARPLR